MAWVLLWLASAVAVAEDAPRYERIVSLSPVLTQVVVDLGQGDRLVGVAEHDFVRPDLPVVGSFNEADIERVLVLKPDVILTTGGADGSPTASAARAGRLAGADVFGWPFPMTLEQVKDMAFSWDDEEGLAHRLGVPERGAALRAKFEAFLGAFATTWADAREGKEPPRVLLLLDTDPISALGPGSPFVELIERLDAASASPLTVGWGVLDRERLLVAGPDVVLLLRPEASLLTEGDERLKPLQPLLDRGGVRVAMVNHPLTLLPSTSFIELTPLIAEAIYAPLDEVNAGLDGGRVRAMEFGGRVKTEGER